jgi:hypothetical protein
MKRLLVVPALIALLGGCVVGGENVRHDMEVSKTAYKACLTQHEAQACEGFRQSYEADLAAYRATPKFVIGAGNPPPHYSGSAAASTGSGEPMGGGQTVYSSHECIGAVVNGQCYGSILPDYSHPHPTCYGQMINGICTGPMF